MIKKPINIAHSPDADDIFMYEAINLGWVSSDFKYKRVADDIQTLNQAAIDGVYDVCAISFGLYPLIQKDYAMLKTAVSFGNGYGPKLIKKKDTKLKPNFKVALSGAHTTNAMIFRLAYPQARIVYKNFLDIENAVLSGEVDAGVLIHESILDFDDKLCVERELWDIWCEQSYSIAKKELTLPLGGMVISRSLPITDAIKIEKELIKAVDVAVKCKKTLSKQLLGMGVFRVDELKLDKYLSMYANDESICLSDEQCESIDVLFTLCEKLHGIKCSVKDNFIPSEYNDIRYED